MFSFCIWTLFTEGWGIDLDDSPDDRRCLIETFDQAKRSFLGKAWLTVSTFDLTSPKAQANPLAPHLLKALAES